MCSAHEWPPGEYRICLCITRTLGNHRRSDRCSAHPPSIITLPVEAQVPCSATCEPPHSALLPSALLHSGALLRLLPLATAQAPANRQAIEQREQDLQREGNHRPAGSPQNMPTVQQSLRAVQRSEYIGEERRHDGSWPGCPFITPASPNGSPTVNHGQAICASREHQRHRTNRESVTRMK